MYQQINPDDLTLTEISATSSSCERPPALGTARKWALGTLAGATLAASLAGCQPASEQPDRSNPTSSNHTNNFSTENSNGTSADADAYSGDGSGWGNSARLGTNAGSWANSNSGGS